MKIPTTSARERYRLDAAQAYADLIARLVAGGDFDRELARFELETQLMRERHNVFLWDGPTTARGYRHPSWPTPSEQAHAMSIEQQPFVEDLYELIGCGGIMELCRMLFQNDMTPPEARLWLEPPDRNWPEVERLLFEIYDRRYPDEEPLPRHLAQWVERYREAHPHRLTSLFE